MDQIQILLQAVIPPGHSFNGIVVGNGDSGNQSLAISDLISVYRSTGIIISIFSKHWKQNQPFLLFFLFCPILHIIVHADSSVSTIRMRNKAHQVSFCFYKLRHGMGNKRLRIGLF